MTSFAIDWLVAFGLKFNCQASEDDQVLLVVVLLLYLTVSII